MYWIFGVFFAFLIVWTTNVVADDNCVEVEARIITVVGLVEIQRNTSIQWLQAKPNDVICRNDLLRSGANSKADILILEETRMALDERTSIRISASPIKTKTVFSNLIDLFAGEAYFRSRKARELNIETPIFNAMHEGTEFLVRVSDDQAQVIVFDGVVLASNQQGQVRVKQGQSAQASKGQAPVIGPRIELRDAVQWTLYYPPVIDYSDSGQLFTNSALQPILGQILNNDLTQAFKQLDAFPLTEQTADYHTLYASLLLTVGQVDEALKHLNQIKQNSPRQAEALSLRSMIALAQNDQPKALLLAQQAEQINTTSPSPHIALSYIYQSQFDIEKALQSARLAAQAGPKNGLAWARVSELELATGNVDESMQAANQAQQLNPRLSKTNTVLGFARLASLELSEAEQSFRDAIARDPADPLARLGLGLAKIRQGHIKSGTRDMETAANLDPGNALIRSYLGKAYYEQRRGTIANTEYKIAKHLDPNDPTPWFYDAIYKQTVNRPVEALHDMQKAIELNDNRAVFRSKLLLDEDLAARSAALGRIYNDLGFQQRGLLEGWKAVNSDPGNYSAHRLLADNYAALPRHEIARVSELLRSQLLQPINVTPVQPQFAESTLLILDGLGSQSASFNEFNPLFARNRFALQASGLYGSHDTWGEELTQSGLWNQFSYSLGQYHLETDGFRDNNDLRQSIYNGFVQIAITPKLNIQAEYRYRKDYYGDLLLRYNPDEFDPTERNRRRQHSPRLGLYYKIDEKSNIIISAIYNKIKSWNKSSFDDLDDDNSGVIFEDRSVIDTDAYSSEIQYMHHWRYLDLTIGAGYFNRDREDQFISIETEMNEGQPVNNEIFIDSVDKDSLHRNAYAYSNINFLRNLTGTIGFSFDSFRSKDKDSDRINPKVGIIWKITPKTIFRAAAFSTVKPPFSLNQTIQPTQVAGFNQFFDDINNTKSWRFGVGGDHYFLSNFYVGGELTWRKVVQPFTNFTGESDKKKREEDSHRAYLYWTHDELIAFSAIYNFDRFKRVQNRLTITQPNELITHRLQLAFNGYLPNGFFTKLSGTYVNQSINNPVGRRQPKSEHGDFWNTEASIGFRLPKRAGILSFGIKNILDKKLSFLDVSLDSDTPKQPVFAPSRTIFGRIKLAFDL